MSSPKKILFFMLKYLLIGLLICTFVYLIIPKPDFPSPLPNSPQSQEPKDTENMDELRAYFTNLSREEIITHYQNNFKHNGIFQFIPSIRLNYPYEEAEWYIYSPIKTSYLEEIVYPLRESVFINAYQPKDSEDIIAFQGQQYQTKITIRFYQSSIYIRIIIFTLIIISIMGIYKITKRIVRSFLAS